jgi:cytochrome b involved in lipid metabolism
MKVVSKDELKAHGPGSTEMWIVIHGHVYNVTNFMWEHPGGAEIIEEHAGTDATQAFSDIHHSGNAHDIMTRLLIGLYSK